jgi:hypothetical protein
MPYSRTFMSLAKAGLFLSAALILLLLAATISVSSHSEFIDQCTGSRKAHRTLLNFWHFDHRYESSALEDFVKLNHPTELQHRWISHTRNGKNLLGREFTLGHGRPGPILNLSLTALKNHCQNITDQEKHQLYTTLLSGDETKCRELVDKILQTQK